ncbi:CRISPR-associated protein Cas4 [Pelagicoccus sp. NFK12]|uniref:CRISPR-associated exonuclease Cas4 n=1 Tax=Pelagicoccus enzymogenes TaxID=2773457 RepID=A0A927F6Z6_9BACT|nr:CRISPR-associated protein Cas4 [Pelagicoccus enzymogenes]MBD5779014.1 CRISPR-associated protein Cas4 [Pelagicoccus enzymogenes]
MNFDHSDRGCGDEDFFVAISALQHWLFCPRQCALIHVERVWLDNRYTAEGNAMHERAHDGPHELREGVRITRGLPVSSRRLGLTGQCDVVEFHPDGRIVPVEYKRGRPKAHRADEVQLCAQALCLEEMRKAEIECGYLYYGKNRRRTEVCFSSDLRALTEKVAAEVMNCIEKGNTPIIEYEAKRCDTCSLLEICEPKALGRKRGAKAWFRHAIANLKPET